VTKLKRRQEVFKQSLKAEHARLKILKKELSAEHRRERELFLTHHKRILRSMQNNKPPLKNVVKLDSDEKENISSYSTEAASTIVDAEMPPLLDEEVKSSSVVEELDATVSALLAPPVRHSRSHSDDSKTRGRSKLLTNLSRADLDRSFSATQLPTLDSDVAVTSGSFKICKWNEKFG
jgi:hypothetical protein